MDICKAVMIKDLSEHRQRCPWAESDPIEKAYHDSEWGRPLFDDRRIFEFLILEGAQAGLSWKTVLYKREGYRKALVNSILKKWRAITMLK